MLASIPPDYFPAILEVERPKWDDYAQIGHPDQFKTLSMLQRRPFDSYLLIGANSTGKTRLAWCLFRKAAESGRSTRFILLSRLLAQYRAAECGDETVKVAVWPHHLESGNWTLCLDEIEKARPSEFSAERLYQLINAVRTHRQQLVVTSNSRLDDIADHWERAGCRYGHSIVKRIDEVCETIELFR